MAESSATLHEAERARRRVGVALAAAALLLALYYGGGALRVHAIDDDPDFTAESTTLEGGSRAIALAADLVEREVDRHRWVANGHDFAGVIRERQLQAAWAQTLASFRDAATLEPLAVTNGAPGGQMLPNHLAAQGVYLLRARAQLKEIGNILLK